MKELETGMKYLRNDAALKQRRQELRSNQTEAEKTFWAHVRNEQFYGMGFFRQYSIGPYILDFYCPNMKLAIELDGGQHNEDDNREYDTARSEYLKAQGIDVVRFWNHDVLLDIRSVLSKLAERVTPIEHNPSQPPLTLRGGDGEVTPSIPLTLRGRRIFPPLKIRGG